MPMINQALMTVFIIKTIYSYGAKSDASNLGCNEGMGADDLHSVQKQNYGGELR